ncbi:MAG: 4Fe-4S dicluster domain-containing protein [Oscillospiraceae bacterium]|nr:4Fe-4S dicluster domain-containing protein [Oscillospiraceae bacterium]
MSLIDKIFDAGIVGCGGAGFPTHVKLSGGAEHLIINGAECEPLLRTDRTLMVNFADRLVSAAEKIRAEIGASVCTFGLKESYRAEIDVLNGAISGMGLTDTVKLLTFTSFYPAGDEHVLVREVTRKTVPPGGLPLDVGCVVLNVSTLLCVYDALDGRPFTDKYLTLTGEVKEPSVLRVPLGTAFTACIERAGGVKCSDYIVVSGGPMMGTVMTAEQAAEAAVTKTTSGIIVLKGDSYMANREKISVRHMLNRARSACIQCSYCTQLCPRFLMGHPLEPHKIMRKIALAGSLDGLLGDADIRRAVLCCECGVCETVACPMDLQPRRVNAILKKTLAEAGIRYPKGENSGAESPMREYRKIPSKRAAVRAGVGSYYEYRITEIKSFEPQRVTLPLKQHIGVPCKPIVESGERVTKGQLIARCPQGKLGVNLHASMDGTVTVCGDAITIEEG